MTPEQLDKIEKLAEAQEFLGAGSYALPLVKALREARAEVEQLRAAITRFVNQYPWQQGPEIQELKALTDRNR